MQSIEMREQYWKFLAGRTDITSTIVYDQATLHAFVTVVLKRSQ